jgi:hypothetical protein
MFGRKKLEGKMYVAVAVEVDTPVPLQIVQPREN